MRVWLETNQRDVRAGKQVMPGSGWFLIIGHPGRFISQPVFSALVPVLAQLLFSCPVRSGSSAPHSRPPCPSPSPAVCSSSCPLRQWCHPAISSSDALFSSCPLAFPAAGTFSQGVSFLHQITKYWSFSCSISYPRWILMFFQKTCP